MRIAVLILLFAASLFADERRQPRYLPSPPECRVAYERLGLEPPPRIWQETSPRKVVWGEDYRQLRQFINPDRVEPYEGFRRVLFLADGEGEENARSMAQPVAARFPGAQVTQGDFSFFATSKTGNLTRRHVDNTRPFDFAEGSQDLVVMRKGLCKCKGVNCCGGIRPSAVGAGDFFGRVGKLLDPTNPKAMAILHGEGIEEVPWPIWQLSSQLAMANDPTVRVDLIRDANGKFAGAKITRVR